MSWRAVQCGSLRAYLDGELNGVGRGIMQSHIRSCAECAENSVKWTEITRQIRNMPDEPVPQFLRERLLMDARGQAVAVTLRRGMGDSRKSPKARLTAVPRLAIVSALVVVVALLFGLTVPTRKATGGTLAAVAAAMDRVTSVHYVGWMHIDGARVPLEGWMDGSLRQRISAGSQITSIKRGKDLLVMTPESVVQRKSEGLLDEELTPLQYFTGDYWRALAAGSGHNDLVVKIERIGMGAGRTGLRVHVRRQTGETTDLTIDDETSLVVRIQLYTGDNLAAEVHDIRYDVEMSDSLFSTEVYDLAAGDSVSAREIDDRAEPGFGFEAMAPRSGVRIVADPARRVFRVFGDVRLTSSGIEISNGLVAYTGEPVTHADE